MCPPTYVTLESGSKGRAKKAFAPSAFFGNLILFVDVVDSPVVVVVKLGFRRMYEGFRGVRTDSPFYINGERTRTRSQLVLKADIYVSASSGCGRD